VRSGNAEATNDRKIRGRASLGMAEALKVQEQDPSPRELSLLERFGLFADQQWNWRENQALSRRLKNAKLRTPNACVEEIDYRTTRGLDKSVIRSRTQQSSWVGMHENVFVLRPTGVGKSFVACALAKKACRDGYSALYTRAQSLFRDLAMARADSSLRSLLSRLSRIDVLVIDDCVMAPLSEPERRDFWEICEDATICARRSSLRNCRSRAGMNKSAIRHSPMAFLTGWSTMHTGSRCGAIRCGRAEESEDVARALFPVSA
jgi:hypothetical protein